MISLSEMTRTEIECMDEEEFIFQLSKEFGFNDFSGLIGVLKYYVWCTYDLRYEADQLKKENSRMKKELKSLNIRLNRPKRLILSNSPNE